MIDLDLYGNPILKTSINNLVSEAATIHLYNPRNFVMIDKVNKDNCFTFFSNLTKAEMGIYLILRLESPMIDEFNFAYTGSSYSCISDRLGKFARSVLGYTTDGDRDYAYCNLFVNKFGRNLNNTYVSFFEVPQKLKTIFTEQDIRDIEGKVISYSKVQYGSVVANKINKPRVSSMTETKKRTRSVGTQKIPESLFCE
jgi:hypothetical protein